MLSSSVIIVCLVLVVLYAKWFCPEDNGDLDLLVDVLHGDNHLPAFVPEDLSSLAKDFIFVIEAGLAG